MQKLKKYVLCQRPAPANQDIVEQSKGLVTAADETLSFTMDGQRVAPSSFMPRKPARSKLGGSLDSERLTSFSRNPGQLKTSTRELTGTSEPQLAVIDFSRTQKDYTWSTKRFGLRGTVQKKSKHIRNKSKDVL